MDRKISTLEHNNRTVYECFNNTFTYEFGSPALNIPPITFDDIPHPRKRSRYYLDLLPSDISVASENYFSTFTTLLIIHISFLLMILILSVLWRNVCLSSVGRKENTAAVNMIKVCYRKTRLYCSTCSDKYTIFYYFYGFSRINSETRACFL